MTGNPQSFHGKIKGGLDLTVVEQKLSVDTSLDDIRSKLDTHKGGIFSSGLEYPGRHSRWDIGFINPALEFISKGKNVSILSLTKQGEFLLAALGKKLKADSSFNSTSLEEGIFKGTLADGAKYFSEEDRTKQPSVFSVLRSIRDFFSSEVEKSSMFGLYGAFGYDLVLQFENLTLKHSRDQNNKDCHLFLPLELTIVDRQTNRAFFNKYILSDSSTSTEELCSKSSSFPLPTPKGDKQIVSDHGPDEFADSVNKVIEGTKKGDYFEVVLSQSFETRCELTPTGLFGKLAEINPSPYLFCLNFGDEQLVGSSPEIYVRVTDRVYETCPIAGTVKRGDSALEDADQVRQLISSLKDESELTMCTDVDRNDMARVCKPGSVKVIGRRQLEFYSHLIHTVDHVCGELDDQYDSLDAFQTHMWACTVTGAPKPAALQEIENLEKSPREWYSGAVGLLLFNGNINTGITLRTAHLRDGRCSTRSGATLLFGSCPKAEEQETLTKAGAFLAAISEEPSGANHRKSSFSMDSLRLNNNPKILLVDCKDSFVHNLAAYMRDLGCVVETVRAGFPESIVAKINPDLMFLSPGPGTPEEFGIPSLAQKYSNQGLPIFGVCLGHQGIAQAFGAELGELPVPKHGKASLVNTSDQELFAGVDEPFEVGRYHSIYVKTDSIPECLSVTAITTGDDSEPPTIMGLRHKTLPVASVQFHPESLMTLKQGAGHKILANAIRTLIEN